MLLFIVLVINKKYKGIPEGLFVLFAHANNCQTSRSYNTPIWLQFLLKWKAALGEKDCEDLTPKPTNVTLLCRFHIAQSWQNLLVRELGSKEPPDVVAAQELVAGYIPRVLQGYGLRGLVAGLGAVPESKNGTTLALFGASSRLLPDVAPSDDATVLIPTLEPAWDPSKPPAGSMAAPMDREDPEDYRD
ncbi:hypothetical protein BDK51DRAFT_37594 [Blyttiomyces helicus]|uniref:MULE transposase domain-containing protein n=1 Tax=Blyttiomyces helicus TaxID=388810 RepID=A0A4P9WMN7_9FUNG|nr:hypothetical protein BDK51DRAFT_37594 [Blyttiomyces helicus]|eukprot:RKO94339.1 hypothetical protein BDK51DRAFT_37594 [Blyttiomyces helicus]